MGSVSAHRDNDAGRLAQGTRITSVQKMASKLIDEKIKSKKVMVFSKTYCPYCTMAKDALKYYLDSGELSADDYEVMEMENRSDCAALQDTLKELTGARSVPRVFINGKCIGGGSVTKGMHESGELK